MESLERERGFSLIEIMVVMFIAAIVALAMFIRFNHSFYSRTSEISSYSSALDHAHAVASSSGNGATIVMFFNSDANLGGSGYFLMVCAGRPISGTSFGPCTQESSFYGTLTATPPAGSALSNEWALYVDSRGTVSAGAWSTSYTNTKAGSPSVIAAEPSCPAGSTITLTFAGGEGAQTHTIDCSSGAFN
jgi:prepilin-type N-terminal cleavage/methylation domain-containing protein